ncbi:MAG: flagellar type III secretion system pore protein FliP [Hypericibacter sp.]
MQMKTAAIVSVVLLGGISAAAAAADIAFPGGSVSLGGAGAEGLSTPLRLVLLLTVLSLAPSILLMVTAFTRIIIVLAMLRHALGMPETPPNAVLVSLALFLTLFTMLPVWDKVNEQAVQPYVQRQISDKDFLDRSLEPIRGFMLAQTREKDILLMLDLAKTERPASPADLKVVHLIPAFMLSELRRAFEIGFVIFLPFVLIDMIVASVLMSLGMIMVPPAAFALPLKILLFVLIDGWNLLAAGLVKSFMAS